MRRLPAWTGRPGIASVALVLAGCASLVPPPPPPITPAARAARAAIERRHEAFRDLRTLAEIRIHRDDRAQQMTGVLLLRAPASLRFEALSPLGTPFLIVAGDGRETRVWEVLDDRGYALPASPAANRRWLGIPLGQEELVALLSGRVTPQPDPRTMDLMAPDANGPSLALRGDDGAQRIWFDPVSGVVTQVEWDGGGAPVRAEIRNGAPDAAPAAIRLYTLDGKLEVSVTYRDPRMNTGFDPELVKLTIPEHVRIQELR